MNKLPSTEMVAVYKGTGSFEAELEARDEKWPAFHQL